MTHWHRDEVILVADLVVQRGWNGIRKESDDARALSALLRRGQLHPGVEFASDFRTPASIQRKSYDVLSADAGYRGKPTRHARQDAEIAKAFRSDLPAMRSRAAAIRAALEAGASMPLLPEEDPGVWEGGILEHLARRRERDPRVRDKKVRTTLAAGGTLTCEVCAIDFEIVYGARGAGYIEVHHIRPLHVSGSVRTRLSDLALLCANCHRMCHRGSWITPTELAAIVAGQKGVH